MAKTKIKNCADMVEKGKGTQYMSHFLKKDYLKKGHNTSGKTNMTAARSDNGDASELLLSMGPGDGVGPDQPRPANPPGGEWIHNPEGGWSLLNFDDSDYVRRKHELQGKR
jgi:hypothetical protein